jgi:hypothetical protein
MNYCIREKEAKESSIVIPGDQSHEDSSFRETAIFHKTILALLDILN